MPIKDYKFELFGIFFIAKLNHYLYKDFKESFTSEISTSTFVIFHAIQKQSQVQIEFELRIECEFELGFELRTDDFARFDLSNVKCAGIKNWCTFYQRC